MNDMLTAANAVDIIKDLFLDLNDGEITKSDFNNSFKSTIQNIDPQLSLSGSQTTFFWSNPVPGQVAYSSEFANGAGQSFTNDGGRAIGGLHYRDFLSNKNVKAMYESVNGFGIDDAGRFLDAPWIVSSIELAKTSSGKWNNCKLCLVTKIMSYGLIRGFNIMFNNIRMHTWIY